MFEHEFEYEPTGHPCPKCEGGLLLVTDSNMLICRNDNCAQRHEPLFLI